MAPEVDRSKKYDTKADIYSLGMVLKRFFLYDFD
jgi:serine/threonine protein kinase